MYASIRGILLAVACLAGVALAPAAEAAIVLSMEIHPLADGQGCVVASVRRGGVADRIGLRRGDVIVRANGQKVSKNVDVTRHLKTDRIDLVVRRGERYFAGSASIAVSTPSFEAPVRETWVDALAEVDSWGMSADSPGPIPGRDNAVGEFATQPWRLGVWGRTVDFADGTTGVQITRVAPGSPSQHLKKVGEAAGKSYRIVPFENYIVSVNGVRMHTYEQMQAALAASPTQCDLRVYNPTAKRDAHYVATLP